MQGISKIKDNMSTKVIHLLLHSCLGVLFAYLLSRSFSNDGSDNAKHPYHAKDVLRAISGSVASALSITLLYPLETIRTRLQVDSTLAANSSFVLIYKIGKREGLGGLYKGWFSLVVALMALNFVYFYCFHGLRRWVTSSIDGDWIMGSLRDESTGEGSSMNKVVIDLVSGFLAGVVAVLVTGPLWLVNTRLKLQGVKIGKAGDGNVPAKQYEGILHCMYKISTDEGILTLWKGTFTSIILSLNPAIQLGVYEMLKRHYFLRAGVTGSDGTGISSGASFVNSFLAKFIATVLTYPIQVLQTRHRAGIAKKEGGADSSATEKKKSWYRAFLGLYRGLESKLLQTCFNSALMFVAYERLVGILTNLLINAETINMHVK